MLSPQKNSDWFDTYTEEFLSTFLPIANEFLEDPAVLKNYMTDYLEFYWIQHYERIKLTIEMLKPYVKANDKILDLGSIFPLSTYYFHKHSSATVVCADLCPMTWRLSDTLRSEHVDLNSDPMAHVAEGWNIINFQEVIEHLACNLYHVRDAIISSLAPNGYLLVGYPMTDIVLDGSCGQDLIYKYGGKDTFRPAFDKELVSTEPPCTHLREFALSEAETFIPLKKLKAMAVFTIGYTRGSLLMLYQKEG